MGELQLGVPLRQRVAAAAAEAAPADLHPAPIYIPGAGSTETMKFCAEKRYTYMSVYAPTPVVKRGFDGYRSAANDLGYEPDPEKLALSIPVYVAETDEQAHAEGRQHIEWLYHKGRSYTRR
jgi:alkanesulfonate monooxygenase SsuD/methylene tetrahydromethanopterin reductase-like flavin-dependent oxidoreductase (luciferase family)